MAEKAEPQHNTAASPFFSGVSFSASSESNSHVKPPFVPPSATALLFQAPDLEKAQKVRRVRVTRNNEDHGAGSGTEGDTSSFSSDSGDDGEDAPSTARKSRRGSRGGRKSADDAVSQRALRSTSNDDDAAGDTEDNTLGSGDSRGEDTRSEHEANRDTKRKRVRKRHTEADEDTGASTTRKSNASASRASDDLSGSSDDETDASSHSGSSADDDSSTVVRRRRRRSATSSSGAGETSDDGVVAPKGSTRLEAKRQRRKEGREAGRRRHTITESEFLARRESVHREMLVRERDGLNQIAVIEDGVLVEHYVARHTQSSMVGNVYLGRVQNVLPSMEAAFVDIGKGRNAVLYAGEVNWEAAGLEGKPRRIEEALKSGDTVLVQVTKDPIGHKGARLTSQITLAGRHLVLVPSGAMTGISRKLPEKERIRLKRILREVVPSEHGVIVRTAAEGASEEQLRSDVERLVKAWTDIEAKSKSSKNAPSLLKGEPELAVRVVRDVFNEDFNALRVQGDTAWETIHQYVHELSPELEDRLEHWSSDDDIFKANRVDEQLAKAFDRKVFLPSGGTLVIDRTEAMTVIDVNTGKFTGSGGTLEETVTRNNLEAAEEIVRQLRLRDIGGIIVIDFIDMVLEANRELVLRRLVECLGRDRTRHQVAEVTSLGLVQMTRKRVGQGLVEAFSTVCEACEGRGYIAHDHPVEKGETPDPHSVVNQEAPRTKLMKKQRREAAQAEADPKQAEVKAAFANIAAAAHKHEGQHGNGPEHADNASDQRSLGGQASNAGASDVTASRSLAGGEENRETESGVSKALQTPADGKKKAVAKRVTSAGTIVPKTSASSAIMSFPVKKDA
ncbi:MAG: Rne/Rng family ribonuclease [Actinomycetaceae bacterium]|nr:Rne/Rng family ribonuclease [Arcanobacterium sp.]MDD7504664.1 Rne/Rng family ribonuclease [Actinomycetaceae bacterium]MDY6143138.1 Rne/Rng family ribonuclease [Arcanobacterium sp.]